LKIAIFGIPKTGTTAVFLKIKKSLPANTFVLFEPKDYPGKAIRREKYVLAKVMMDNTIAVPYDDYTRFDKKILITRDPRDWAVSSILFTLQQLPELYNDPERLSRILELLRQKEQDPASISVTRIAQFIWNYLGTDLNGLKNYVTTLHKWFIEFESELKEHYRLRYEDFVKDDMQGLEDYLGLELKKEFQLPKGLSHVVRTKGSGDWANWFTMEDIGVFRPWLKPYMDHYNYPDLWELNNPDHINPEYCTEYVKRTVAKRKREMNIRSGKTNKE